MLEPIGHTIQTLMLDAMRTPDRDLATRIHAAQMIIESASERGWISDDEFYSFSSHIDTLANTEMATESPAH